MLKTIARFHLVDFRRVMRGANGPLPASDNVRVHGAERSRRFARPQLFCRWSRDEDGLMCRWSAEVTEAPELRRLSPASRPLQASSTGSGT